MSSLKYDRPATFAVFPVSKPLPPIEQLSWAGLTEDDFVERLAQQVWRRNGSAARVGVSRSKVQAFLRAVGAPFPTKDRQRIVDRVLQRAHALFDEQCAEWAVEMCRDYNWMCGSALDSNGGRSRETLRNQLWRYAPPGAHQRVLRIVLREFGLD